MISVPEPIQELFKRDGVLKNLRITFPNGERDDIANDQILMESLSFTETLASSDPITFGLCEASSISFNCVGVENINGMEIFVYIEIDISSLTAAQKAEWGKTSNDVPFVYYQVPLGLFIVDECRRQNDINIRSVVAYSPFLRKMSEVSAFQNLMPYDQKKASGANWSTAKTMTVDWRNLAVLAGQSIFDYNDLSPLALDSRVTKINTDYTKKFAGIAGTGWDGEGHELRIDVIWKKRFAIDLNAWDYTDSTWTVIDCKSLPWTGNYIWWWGAHDKTVVKDFAAMKEQIRQEIRSIIRTVSPTPSAPNIDAYVNNTLDSACYSGYISHAWKINASSNPVAPTSSSDNGTWDIPINSYFALNGEPSVIFPMEIEVTLYSVDGGNETVLITDTFDLTDNGTVELYQIDPAKSVLFGFRSNNPWGSGFFQFAYSSEKINERQSFANVWKDMPFGNMLEYMLEVNGCFGGLDRYGNFCIYDITAAVRLLPSYEIFPSNNIYPCSSENTAHMSQEDYIDVWYDEYVLNYGSIHVEYKDSNGDIAEYNEYLYDDEEKAARMPVYDLSSNELFSKIVEFITVEKAVACIKKAIKALAYFRAEISMRALPYIEAGDMLFVRATDDDFVTPVLSQTITGIQDLRANISSI